MMYNNLIERLPFTMLEASNGCMLNGVAHLMRKYTSEDQIRTFWNSIAITADDNQCWLWLASRQKKGYGTKQWNGKIQLAHRIAWSYPNYVIPDGMEVCHSCDNPSCCNPKHLFLGTHQDNMDDMIKKNRDNKAKGESNGFSKLTESQVVEIRSRYKKHGDYSKLGREYGVCHSTISRIVNMTNWKE